ncbi:MAG: hypothetical protein KC418_10020, partial [Anaerolineales bacterium]|nr:hypothetical protein [Anaerolineales bacterium]
MIESNETSYLAIITISLPSHDQAITARVIMHPSDTVDIGDDQAKRLGDCTLAELQTFADALEADVWQAYQAIRLADLQQQEDITVGACLAESTGGTLPLDTLLDHMILLTPPVATGELADTVAEAAPPAADVKAQADLEPESVPAKPIPEPAQEAAQE